MAGEKTQATTRQEDVEVRRKLKRRAKALNDALRAVMNEGAGLATVGPQVVYLLVLALATFALALRLFRWS